MNLERPSIKLNLGCGNDLKEGYLNVDLHGGNFSCDLNNMPWPWADDSVCEVLLHNVLEHLPNTVSVMKEVYRVCANDALVHIAVPHPRHDDFLNDPTHVSPITIEMMRLFSKEACRRRWRDANNPIAVNENIDFELVRDCYVVEKRWMERVEKKEITELDLRDAILTLNNVVKQIEMTLKVVK